MADSENSKPTLELDNEFTDEWSVTATFFTGEIPDDQLGEMICRDPFVVQGRQMLVTIHDHEQGTTEFATNEYIDGTQQAALEVMSHRFTAILGELAVADRVMKAAMNPGAVSSAIAEEQLERYGFYDLDEDSELPEGWEGILEAPSAHQLDVTEHLRRMLG